MSSKGHNKRRNVGLLYEFLVGSVSRSLVAGDQRRAGTALRIIRRHFRPGTELHREFRLVSSLVRTTVSTQAVAASILQEAKRAARSLDRVALDREKSILIGTINRSLGDADFFDHPVAEYRDYATVQTLVNDWRAGSPDIGRMAEYEDRLVSMLVAEKVDVPDSGTGHEESPGTNRLLMRVMMRRLNEKYAGALTDEQRSLVKAYAFSAANDDPGSVRLKLEEARSRLLSEIDSSDLLSDPVVGARLVEARAQVASESLEHVDDDTVTRFMLYMRLRSELTEKEDA